MENCIFCQIVSGQIPSHKVWEDDQHLAFLSIFPNTDGVTVVIPKDHHNSYIFAVEQSVRANLIEAAECVSKKITAAFSDVGRVGLIFEGFGVNHLHAKLFPMHGTASAEWTPHHSNIDTFFTEYQGYLSSHDSHRADNEYLLDIAEKIRNA